MSKCIGLAQTTRVCSLVNLHLDSKASTSEKVQSLCNFDELVLRNDLLTVMQGVTYLVSAGAQVGQQKSNAIGLDVTTSCTVGLLH